MADLVDDTDLDLLEISQASVEYSGIAPIQVNNTTYTIGIDESAFSGISGKLDTSAFEEWSANYSGGGESPWISGSKVIGNVTADWGNTYQVISSFDLSGDHNHAIGLKGSNITFPTTAGIQEELDKKLYISSFSSYTSNADERMQNIFNLANSAYTTAVNNFYNKADLSAISGWSGDINYISGVVDDKLDASSFDPNAFYPSSNPSGFITGVDLSDYYKKTETSSKEEISAALTGKLNNDFSGNFYPMTGNPSGFLTEHQDLSDYAKTEDLTAYQPVGDYYSASNPSGFITGVDLSNYYQKNETSSKEEIEAALQNFEPLTPEQLSAIETISSREFISAISADVSAWSPWISGWKTIGAVTANWGDTFQVISSHDFSGFHNHSIGLKGSNITLPSTAAIGEALDNKLDLSSFSSYTSNTYNYISAVNALANSAYTTAVNNYYNKADLSAVSSYSSDLTYLSGACDYLSGQTEQKLDKASADTLYYPLTGNPSGFITEHQSLEDYYKKTETSSKEEISAALTGKQDAGNYYSASNPSGFITGVDLSEYAKTEDLTAYYPTSNPSGFITAVDLSNYYQKNETSSKQEISAAINALSGDYVRHDELGCNIGTGNTLYGYGFVQGLDNTAGTNVSTADPHYKTRHSIAIGYQNKVNTDSSSPGVALGLYNTAEGGYVIGASNSAESFGAAIGDGNSAYASVALGFGLAISSKGVEDNNTPIHHYTWTDYGVAIGRYNKTSSDVAFVIGNGSANDTSGTIRSDLFLISSDGLVSGKDFVTENGIHLSSVTSLGKTYEGVAPIVVNNTADKISADVWSLSAGNGLEITEDNNTKTTTISITGGGAGSQSKYYVDTPQEHTSADVDLTLWVTATQAGYYARRVYAGSDMVGELTPPGSAGSAGQYLGITGSSIRWMDINIPSGAYGVRTEIVATSGDATGTGIVYIVTGNS